MCILIYVSYYIFHHRVDYSIDSSTCSATLHWAVFALLALKLKSYLCLTIKVMLLC